MKFNFLGNQIEITKIKNIVSPLPPLSGDNDWSDYLRGAGYSDISADTAIKVAAVYRCVDLISKIMASLPLQMLRDTETGKEKAKNHRLYNLLSKLPNKSTTAYEFWQMYIANLLLTPRALAKIERNRQGFITALYNIPTAAASAPLTNTINGERYIVVDMGDGRVETLHRGEYMMTNGFRFESSAKASDPMTIASEVLSLSSDLYRYAKTTFAQGVNPGGFIEMPTALSEEAYRNLKEDFARNYAGVANAGKFIILEEGGKASLVTRDMEKTQNLESRKFAISEICRIFGVPPHMCMDMDHATFSNIEQQSQEFVRDCINPLSVRLEQTLYRDLLTSEEQKTYYYKFNTNALLRGDTATRQAYYHAMRQDGVMNANEIREYEDMNSMGPLGDIYFINGNMLPLEFAKLNAPKSAQKA